MQTLLSMIEHHGLWLVLANVFALQFGLPVPAYPTLIVVGALTSRGDFTPWQVIGVAVAGQPARRPLVVRRRQPPRPAGAAADVPAVAVAGQLRAPDRADL